MNILSAFRPDYHRGKVVRPANMWYLQTLGARTEDDGIHSYALSFRYDVVNTIRCSFGQEEWCNNVRIHDCTV